MVGIELIQYDVCKTSEWNMLKVNPDNPELRLGHPGQQKQRGDCLRSAETFPMCTAVFWNEFHIQNRILILTGPTDNILEQLETWNHFLHLEASPSLITGFRPRSIWKAVLPSRPPSWKWATRCCATTTWSHITMADGTTLFLGSGWSSDAFVTWFAIVSLTNFHFLNTWNAWIDDDRYIAIHVPILKHMNTLVYNYCTRFATSTSRRQVGNNQPTAQLQAARSVTAEHLARVIGEVDNDGRGAAEDSLVSSF